MSRTPGWNSIETLPLKNGNSWAIWKGGQSIDMERVEVEALVARWLPANPVLIGAPGRGKYLPPVMVPEFEQTSLSVVGRNFRTMLVALVTCGVLLLAVSATKPASGLFVLGLLALALAAATTADYYLGMRRRDALAERALFFYWLKNDSSAKIAFVTWAAIALGTGAAQLLLQWRLGGLDQVFYRFGAMYADINVGEYWRLLSGPYLHYSLMHYLNNAVLLVFAGTLASALLGRSAIGMFFFGNAAAVFAQMTLGGAEFDNFGGMSGGVYTLFGMLIAAGATNRRLFPKGLWLLISNLTVLGLVASEALSGHAASVAHVTGLLLGGSLGLLIGRQGRLN